jgi:hypothetical protein
MGSEKRTMKPARHYVLIKNPLFGKIDDLEKGAEELPEEQRQEFVTKALGPIWENIEVVAVGEGVLDFKAGDIVVTDARAIANGMYISEEEYLLVRDNAFMGTWV